MRSRRSSLANFGEAFLSATSASDVGSTQDDVLGFHGHALRSRRRSALRNPSRAAARFTKLDSTPQESSSHRTPLEWIAEFAPADRYGDAQRGAPTGNVNLLGRPPAPVGRLPRFEQRPCTVGCRLSMKRQRGISGRLEPGLLTGKVSPAAVGILGTPQSIQAYAKV